MHVVIAFLVFAAGIGATAYYWNNLRQSVRTDMQTAYKQQMTEITSATGSRFHLYENFLRSSAGLFKIQTTLTQAQWEDFQKPFNIQQLYPDIGGIGASRYINSPDSMQVFLDQHRQEDPGYAEPLRRTAMDRAIDTGQPAMSGMLKLMSEGRPDRAAFIIYMPIFSDDAPVDTVAQRRAAIMGFTYIAIDGKTLIDELLTDSHSTNVGLQMMDAEQSNQLLYQSSNFTSINKEAGGITGSYQTTLYGHKWNLTFTAAPALLPAHERQLPQQALWRGILTCIFFAMLVWYLITDRERKYARQKQEEVQTAKDDLLSLASHQLRTPATVVKQYVGMLMQGYAGKLTGQQMNMLESAYESNEHQLEIINQLLYVARLDADSIKLHTEKTDIAKLMRDVARDQAQTALERNQQIVFRIPPRELWVEVDPHYLRMVLDNLLSNAVKYTPEGGTITLSVRRAHGHIAMRVADTGVGIELALQPTVFEKFTRVENPLSNDVNGSGVGLYLTQKIVQLHRGSIDVKSAVGKGSIFTVRVPVRPPPDKRSR